ncbi:MAG: hypothetical protein ACOC26_04500 [Halochromatium sp.]
MPTQPVRKFAISVDPDEVVDFEEDLPYFAQKFEELGFERVTPYKFRYLDRECTLTADLKSTIDGFELWILVQAPDMHEYRLAQISETFCASIVAGPNTGVHSKTSTAFSNRTPLD